MSLLDNLNLKNCVITMDVSAPASFGHLAGVDVDSAPEGMWTPCRRA
jgi:hypothetical protein